jgi:hypothetical protein
MACRMRGSRLKISCVVGWFLGEDAEGMVIMRACVRGQGMENSELSERLMGVMGLVSIH